MKVKLESKLNLYRAWMASCQRPAAAQAEMSDEKCTVLGATAGWCARMAANTSSAVLPGARLGARVQQRRERGRLRLERRARDRARHLARACARPGRW